MHWIVLQNGVVSQLKTHLQPVVHRLQSLHKTQEVDDELPHMPSPPPRPPQEDTVVGSASGSSDTSLI